MRQLSYFQKEINQEEILEDNDLFTFYITQLVKSYNNDEEYDIINAQDDDFIIPGKMEIKIDGYKACIELSSDVLSAIYQIVTIKNIELENRFKEGKDVDLREYF